MDLNDTPEQAAYREQVRAWLEEHKARGARPRSTRAGAEDDAYVAARRALAGQARRGRPGRRHLAEGVRRPGPRARSSRSSSTRRSRAPACPGILDVIGVGMLGPTIIAHGTDEQKARYLGPDAPRRRGVVPALLRARRGLRPRRRPDPRARQDDDGTWVLNGQKVWTTNAQFAAYGLLLARTDPDVPKHKGLTMFIVPMDAEGVTIRGLRQISGEAEFNEVFFDDVQLDADAVVGGVDNGWGTALTTLMFERVTIGLGSEGMGYRADRFAARDRRRRGRRAATPSVRQRLGEIATELLAVRFTGYRTLTALPAGPDPRPGGRPGEGHDGQRGDRRRRPDRRRRSAPRRSTTDSEWAYMISFLPGLKSAGGTEEILRNTIGERVLGLPPEPRLDKGIPFSELRAKEKEAVAA